MANPNIADYWQGYRDARITVLMTGFDVVKRLITPTENAQYNEGFKKGLDRVNVDISKLIAQDAKVNKEGK